MMEVHCDLVNKYIIKINTVKIHPTVIEVRLVRIGIVVPKKSEDHKKKKRLMLFITVGITSSEGH